MTPAKRERVATIIVEASVNGDAAALKKHTISDRALRRYRAEASKDPELADLVRSKRAKVEEGWAEEIPGALRAAIGFLRKAAEEADHKDPDVIYSVAGAFKLLNEAAATWKVLDARLARQNRPVQQEAGPTVPGGSGAAPRPLGLVASNGSH